MQVSLPFVADTTNNPKGTTTQHLTTTPPAASGTALAVLSNLPVKGRARKTGYTRAKFGAPHGPMTSLTPPGETAATNDPTSCAAT